MFQVFVIDSKQNMAFKTYLSALICMFTCFLCVFIRTLEKWVYVSVFVTSILFTFHYNWIVRPYQVGNLNGPTLCLTLNEPLIHTFFNVLEMEYIPKSTIFGLTMFGESVLSMTFLAHGWISYFVHMIYEALRQKLPYVFHFEQVLKQIMNLRC